MEAKETNCASVECQENGGQKNSSAAFLGVLTRELETHLYKKQFQLILVVQLLQKACVIL